MEWAWEQHSEAGRAEAGGSVGQEADGRRAVATVLKSITAEAAEATKKNMHWHIKHTNITRDWVPAAWLSGPVSRAAGEGQERQGPSQTESSLTGVILPI